MIFLIIAAFLLATTAAAADGMLEGYLFDGRESFERKYGVDKFSFWGSKSYARPKTGLEKVVGMLDFYHVADDLRKYGYIIAGELFGVWGVLEYIKFDDVNSIIFAGLAAGILLWAGKFFAMKWIRS